jgi:3-(3-hydroxy-phenyl)propionate hydroxylase
VNAPQHTSVVIVGAGPTGLTLANLLGCEGIDTLVIERNPGCVPEPRAIAIDGESLRTLQAVGLTDTVLPTLKQGFVADYINGAGEHLFTTDLRPKPYGFCLQNSFDQPTLERQLRAGLDRFDCVQVRYSTALADFRQDDTAVSATVEPVDGDPYTLTADFLVACDGGRSTVRQALGIAMRGDRLPQKWLVVDTVDRKLTGEPECRFFCDPARPAMTLLRPAGERRWEWMLMEGESDEDMLSDQRISELLSPHTDPDQVQVYRRCVYGFSAVVAERFREGRIFLAGDAAHMTPPFAGQGLNAGIRDARNLSWKLAAVSAGRMPMALLNSYNLERHDAAREIVDLAVMLGDQIQPTDAQAAAERDAVFAELNKDPDQAAAFGRDIIAPLFDVRLKQGWMGPDPQAGRLLPQPEVSTGGQTSLLDDSLGDGFIALNGLGTPVPEAWRQHPLWQALRPTEHPLDPSLQDFAGPEAGSLLLIRPDRFVLATLTADSAFDTLEELHRALSAMPESPDPEGV